MQVSCQPKGDLSVKVNYVITASCGCLRGAVREVPGGSMGLYAVKSRNLRRFQDAGHTGAVVALLPEGSRHCEIACKCRVLSASHVTGT